MVSATWYFDFVSPFAYLQWQRVRALSDRVGFDLRPILFAGLLDRHGHKGPAEIPAKRVFTYRFVQWRADQRGVPLNFPPAHPFNPLPALRLCIAAGSTASVVDRIFNHLWRDGLRGDDAESLSAIARGLGVADCAREISSPEVKNALRNNFELAVADQVFGVPTIVADEHLFWGDDATAMFEAYLKDPKLFTASKMKYLERLPIGKSRM